MSVKATECSELSGVMLKPVFLNPLLATAALFDILPLILYLSWGVSKLLELQCNWKVTESGSGPHKETINNLSSWKKLFCLL